MALAEPQQTRPGALREALKGSERLAREANLVLEGYGSHLDALMRSVERVAARAQTLTNARRQIDGALTQTNELIRHLDTPRKVQARIKQGPNAGLGSFLSTLELLEECIDFLDRHRNIQTAQDSLDQANELCDEAMLLCFDDFQSHVKHHTRMPLNAAKVQDQEPSPGAARSGEEAMPPEVADRLHKLNKAMQRHGNNNCLKVYTEVRMSMLENMHLNSLGKRAPLDDLHRLTWLVVERRIQAWIAMNADVAANLLSEQQLAFRIFGRAQGQAPLLEILKPWTSHSSQSATKFVGYRRVPEKAFGLILMGEKTAECLPVFAKVLPDSEVRLWQKLLASFAVEARETFIEFRTFLAADLQKYTVGDGSVHPLAAQTFAFLKRLLTYQSAAAIIFMQTEPPNPDSFKRGVQSPAQRQALREGLEQLLNLLWNSLSTIARSCKNKALAALFLMNNAHYQLKATQAATSLNAISHDWQDECENKVEANGTAYQNCAWDPILDMLREDAPASDLKPTWLKEKVSIKEKWRHISSALEAVIEQQRTWSVPDFALRANLRDAVVEDFLPAYTAFWRKHEVLPFAKNMERYMRVSPEELMRIVNEELFDSHSAPEPSGHSITA